MEWTGFSMTHCRWMGDHGYIPWVRLRPLDSVRFDAAEVQRVYRVEASGAAGGLGGAARRYAIVKWLGRTPNDEVPWVRLRSRDDFEIARPLIARMRATFGQIEVLPVKSETKWIVEPPERPEPANPLAVEITVARDDQLAAAFDIAEWWVHEPWHPSEQMDRVVRLLSMEAGVHVGWVMVGDDEMTARLPELAG